MGQAISVPLELRVSLAEFHDLLNDTYTVERTSGKIDSGWRIPGNSPVDQSIEGPCASIHAVKNDVKGWRIFMDNSPKDINELFGGWRRIETIWPTRLDGDADAIHMWRKRTIDILQSLEEERLEKERLEKERLEKERLEENKV
jgi:hypothetical protein